MSRQIFPQEDFRSGKGLTDEQAWFDRLWRKLEPIQRGREELRWVGIGFKPAVKRDGPASRGRVTPIAEDRLVVRAEEVNAVLLHGIPTRYWRGARQNRQYRLQLVECPIRFYAEEGELHIAPTELPEKEQKQLYVADLSMNPRQDGPVLAERNWAPNQMIPTSPEFSSPWKGRVELQEGPLYLDVTVDGNVALRIPAADRPHVELAVRDGETVGEYDTLAVAVGKCRVGVPVTDPRGRPVIDRVSPPVVSATRKKPLLRLGLRLLEFMLEPGEFVPPHQWAPRQLAEFSPENFESLTSMPGWFETPLLRHAICEACGPQGQLRLRFPGRQGGVYTGREGDTLQFRLLDGAEVELPVPSSAFVSLAEGDPVTPNGVIGDWVPPQRPWGPEKLREAVGDFWPALVRAFLAHEAIRPGELGYRGLGVLLPSHLVGPALKQADSLTWLDFRPCQKYLTEDGAVAPPPIPRDDWRDFAFMLGGIGVDMTPVGDRLTDRPITEHRRAEAKR